MLITNDVYKNSYTTNGSVKEFPITFPFFDNSHVILFMTDEVGEAVPVNKNLYTLAGAGNPAGGTCTFGTAPIGGRVLAIVRDVPITQLHKYTELDNFPAESHEDALAKLTMICQQLAEELARTIKVPVTSEDPPELLAQLIFEARDEAMQSAADALVSEVNAATSEANAAALLEDVKLEHTNAVTDIQTTHATAAADIVAKHTGAVTDIQEKRNAAVSDILNNRAEAVTDIQVLHSTSISDIQKKHETAITDIQGQHTTAITDIEGTKASALSAVIAQEQTSVTAVQQTGEVQVSAVNAAANNILAVGSQTITSIVQEGDTQVLRVQAAADKGIVEIGIEGDRQVQLIAGSANEALVEIKVNATNAKESELNAERWAQEAKDLTGLELASPANIGICPRIGSGLEVVNNVLNVKGQTLLSTPVLEFPIETAIGFEYELKMMSTTAIPGAAIQAFTIWVDKREPVTILASDGGIGSYFITVDGLDLEDGEVIVEAVDTVGNASQKARHTYRKRKVTIWPPRILSPAEGATNVPLKPEVTLGKFESIGMPDTPATSQLQIATDALFADVVYDTGAIAYFTQHTVSTELPNGVPLYLRARHAGQLYGNGDYGPVTSVSMVEKKALAPSIVSPVNGSTDQSVSTAVAVSPLKTTGVTPSPEGTHLQLAKDEAFADIVFEYNSNYATTISTSGLPIITKLYARVKHMDAVLGATPWSAVSSFTTLNAYTEAPTVLSPTTGQVLDTLSVTVQLSAFSNVGPVDTPKSTFIEVRKVSDSSLVVTYDGPYITEKTFEESIFTLKTQYSVIARHTGNTWGESAASPAVVFTTVNAYTTKAEILQPSSGQTGLPLRPAFTFSAFANVGPVDTGANTHFQLSKNSLFTDLVTDTTVNGAYITSYTPPSDVSINTPLWARVRHRGGKWGWAQWSDTWTGTTLNAYIKAPTVTSPAEGQTGLPLTPTITLSAFEWIGITDTPAMTRIQVATDAAFGNVVAEWHGSYKTSWAVPTALALNTIHYVRAFHQGNLWGISAWSGVRTFRTTNAYVNKPVIIAPETHLRKQSAEIVTAPFSGVAATHVSTDWRITDKNTGAVIAEALNSPDKLAHKFNLSWTPVRGVTNGATWQGFAFGNSKFVVAGETKISTSTDGVTWAPSVTVGKYGDHIDGVAFGNGRFVTVGMLSKVHTSENGTDWVTGVIDGPASRWRQISFANGKFVAVGDGGKTTTSTDGLTWTPVVTVSGMSAVWQGLAFGNGKFVTVGDSGKSSTSTDGVNWTPAVSFGGTTWTSVSFGNGKFVAVGDGGKTTTSTDGLTWSPVVTVSGMSAPWYTSTFGAGKFVAAGGGGVAAVSTDGISWGPVIDFWTTNNNWFAAEFLNGKLMLGGNNSWVTVLDGFVEKNQVVSITAKHNATAGGVALVTPVSDVKQATVIDVGFVAVGSGGKTSTSTDGLTWTPVIAVSGQHSNWHGVAYGNDKFVAVGDGGKTTTSMDGLTWTAAVVAVSGQTNSWYGVTFANGKFVAVGFGGKTSTSTDGLTWTPVIVVSGQTNHWNGVAYGNGKFVAVGDGGKTSTSTDGLTWTLAVTISGQTISWFGVTYSNGNFVAVGANGKTSTSTDGLTWTPIVAVNGQSISWRGVTYGNDRFVAVGDAGKTSPSTYGLTWTTAIIVSGQTSSWLDVTYGNGKFVTVGYGGKTSTSTDGLTWTTAIIVSGQGDYWRGVTY